MRRPFVSRSRHEATLAEIEALRRRVLATEARHDEVEGKRRNLARWLAEANATNKRLAGHNTELRRRLDAVHDAAWVDAADADRLQARVQRLRKVAARLAAALRQAQAVQAAPVSEADRQAIARWELRVKAHDAWRPPTDRDEWPPDGASGRPLHPAVALLRAMDRCRALEQKLADVEGRKRGVVL